MQSLFAVPLVNIDKKFILCSGMEPNNMKNFFSDHEIDHHHLIRLGNQRIIDKNFIFKM